MGNRRLRLYLGIGTLAAVFGTSGIARPYRFTTWAGLGEAGYADGRGREAMFNAPAGVFVGGGGTVYVADTRNCCIRKIALDGDVSLFSGTPGKSGHADGSLTNALYTAPRALAMGVDGSMYVADLHTVRKIASDGQVRTLAGNPRKLGYADGTNETARFNSLSGIAVDGNGMVYLSESGNSVIRRMAPDGVVVTLAGKAGERGYADGYGDEVRFNRPMGICVATDGTVFVADNGNQVVRSISADGRVRTVAGRYRPAEIKRDDKLDPFLSPRGMVFSHDGSLYVTDTVESSVFQVSPDGKVIRLGGRIIPHGDRRYGFHLGRIARDGAGVKARFNRPAGIAVDANGVLYIADSEDHTIRKGLPVR